MPPLRYGYPIGTAWRQSKLLLSGVSKMKKNILLISLLLMAVLPSCFHSGVESPVTPEAPAEAPPVVLRNFEEEDQLSALALATGFAESFIKSVESGEYSFWEKKMTPETAKKVNGEKFLKMREELQKIFGDFKEASFMGELISGNLRSYLWKLRFTREKDGKPEISETVYFVRVFCEEGKAPAISGFGVKVF